ncbi:hypothetical protein LUZ60_006684 [Juncus effusus]|nr:hypothetical protein LUZ60_006684 [Juncus effusus]
MEQEDPAKRRERLLALRTQGGGPAPPVQRAAELPDPMFSDSSPAASAERPRFDFYTNPSAGFVGNYGSNKRKNDESAGFARPNVGPRNYMNNPRQSPTHQFQPPFNPHWRSPVQFQPPSQPYPPGAPGPWTTPPTNPNPNFIRGGFTNPNYTHPPRGGYSSPNPNYSHPLRGRFSNPNHNPNFIRGCRPGTSPNPNFFSGSRGRGGGRGLGFNNRSGNGNFYDKSMVEDPWIELEPIVGKLVESLNESVRKNEFRNFDKGGNSSSNNNNKNNSEKNNSNNNEKKLSLAEYLDLSFNQAIDET